MGKNSKIEWTHHTFNPWWGCTRVSEAYVNCYAESWSKRLGKKLWGPKADRRFFSEKHWNEPRKWDAEAKASGVRTRVNAPAVKSVLVGVLVYLAAKFADEPVGEMARIAWSTLKILLGIH